MVLPDGFEPSFTDWEILNHRDVSNLLDHSTACYCMIKVFFYPPYRSAPTYPCLLHPTLFYRRACPLAMRDLTPHDLCRTAASWAVQSGAFLAVVAASLGHADTRVTEAHYRHLSDDPVRRMLADNAGRLLASVSDPITSGKSPAHHAQRPPAEREACASCAYRGYRSCSTSVRKHMGK